MSVFSHISKEFDQEYALQITLLAIMFIISFMLLIGAYLIKIKRIERENTSFFKIYNDLI